METEPKFKIGERVRVIGSYEVRPVARISHGSTWTFYWFDGDPVGRGEGGVVSPDFRKFKVADIVGPTGTAAGVDGHVEVLAIDHDPSRRGPHYLCRRLSSDPSDRPITIEEELINRWEVVPPERLASSAKFRDIGESVSEFAAHVGLSPDDARRLAAAISRVAFFNEPFVVMPPDASAAIEALREQSPGPLVNDLCAALGIADPLPTEPAETTNV